MTARAFLVRGLIAGLVAGIATFLVAYAVGEPPVDAAIVLEEAGSADEPVAGSDHDHDDAEATDGHVHSSGGAAETVVTRGDQKTWGLLTGTLAIGLALGGVVSLVAAGAVGRMGLLMPGQSTAVVALVGFVSFALVPFLKYPANPPAVGSGDTIGDRTALYFGFVLVSVLAGVLATYAAVRLFPVLGSYAAVVVPAVGYLVVVVAAGRLLPAVDEVGDFPADTLWSFRLASLLTLATLWAVLGVVLSWLVSRLHARESATQQRRELAASL